MQPKTTCLRDLHNNSAFSNVNGIYLDSKSKADDTSIIRSGSKNILSIIKLSGEQVIRLQQALLSAFPSVSDLQFLVRTGLEEQLDAIIGG